MADTARAPAVSVVIPCYQQAQYLELAVMSVLGQTFADHEVIVVDDGSPDESAAVARSLAARFPACRISLLRQENAGLAEARNAGIRMARGRYVLPLDADDAIDATFLEKTVGALEANPDCSVAFVDVVRFGAESGIWKMGPWDEDTLRRRNVAVCTSLFRREVWETLGGYNPNMVFGYEDYDFWVGCIERGMKAVHVPEPLFFYRVKQSSMVSGAMRNHVPLYCRVILNHPRFFPQAAVDEARRYLEANPLPAHRRLVKAAPRPAT
ncbi:glycosyltransferase family 2 protein [Anaeromyxobacter paludicola]|uniref:Glycosyl transferase n=1 Tax=Anaeromyxobacter paludicola TaxID=2918171 RepID=A0ABM7X5J5_9BACT|nr:glycosyltransferase family A protein [Anaeromyxobacter paludicola]BDG07078.1 glycosyl transferase [Anaeromyxobacter paludicola]